MNKGQIGLYFHWPFCLSKCPYCDFNVHVREGLEHERWRDAYLKSLEYYAGLMPERTVRSVFFGGGTPSLMAPETVQAVLDKVHSLWPCANDMEITLEANPTSVEAGKFADFRTAGVNRVSIGVQALNDADLKFLGRAHNAVQAREAIETACSVFDRYSFDLIYARPEQSLKNWQQELEMSVDLSGGHLSLYQLTIERNTPFYFAREQGKFSMPKEELAADFYLLTQDVLNGAGLPAYEVSNHAIAGQKSAHNLIYWRYGDYIGIGPGAHGRLSLEGGRKVATREHHAPDVWLERVEGQGSGVHPFEELSGEDQFMEALMMGLRLREGVEIDWSQRIDRTRLEALQEQDDLSFGEGRITLTQQGMLRLNAIVPYLLK